MKLSKTTSVVVFCQVAAILDGSDAFVVSKSAMQRAAAMPRSGGNALVAATMDQIEQVLEGPVVDLRGGKSTAPKKAASGKGKKTPSAKGRSSKHSKSSKGAKKPSFMATVKAFFHSLVNPHFALKLQAKKEQHSSVHSSGSA